MLSKIPDRRKIYYKITNQKENHHGLQYHDGLILDPVEFNGNPEGLCVKGGIYFTTKEYIHRFFGYGQWIRPVKLPSNANVVLDPSGDKYRADRLFFKPRKNFNFYFDELFNKKTFPEEEYWYITKYCLNYFNKWFNKNTFPKAYYMYLAIYCPEYFDKWFDKEVFPIEQYWSLVEYCHKHFNIWFNKKTFPKEKYCYTYLAMYCSSHFDKWFDKETYPKEEYQYLIKHCSEYKHIWKKFIK